MSETDEKVRPAALTAGARIAIVALLLAAVAVAATLKGYSAAKPPKGARDVAVAASATPAPKPGVAAARQPSAVSTLPTAHGPVAAPKAQALPRLLELGSTKCIPCQAMAPILEELRTENAGKLQVDFIDVWVNRDAQAQYNLQVIPTQIFFDAAGKELFRHEGFFAKADILAKWRELGVVLNGAASEPRVSPPSPHSVH